MKHTTQPQKTAYKPKYEELKTYEKNKHKDYMQNNQQPKTKAKP